VARVAALHDESIQAGRAMLDSMSKIMLLAAIALPLLLIAALFVSQRRQRSR
jgi:hypothetical protein